MPSRLPVGNRGLCHILPGEAAPRRGAWLARPHGCGDNQLPGFSHQRRTGTGGVRPGLSGPTDRASRTETHCLGGRGPQSIRIPAMKIHMRSRCHRAELRGSPQAARTCSGAGGGGQGVPLSLLNAAVKGPLGIASLEPHHLNFTAIILTFANS